MNNIEDIYKYFNTLSLNYRDIVKKILKEKGIDREPSPEVLLLAYTDNKDLPDLIHTEISKLSSATGEVFPKQPDWLEKLLGKGKGQDDTEKEPEKETEKKFNWKNIWDVGLSWLNKVTTTSNIVDENLINPVIDPVPPPVETKEPFIKKYQKHIIFGTVIVLLVTVAVIIYYKTR